MAIDVNSLLEEGRCFACLDPVTLRRLYAALLCKIVRVGQPEFECGNNLFSDGCITCLPINKLRFLQTQLLCELAKLGNPVFNCEVDALVESEPCVACLDPAIVQKLETIITSKILVGLDAGADIEPSAIMADAPCLVCLYGQQLEVAITSLLIAWLEQSTTVDVAALLDSCDCKVLSSPAGPLLPEVAILGAILSAPPPPACDAEVENWADVRVPAAGGTVSASTRQAACDFMAAITAAGLRSKILRLNLFAGDQLAAAVVPLIIDAGGATDVPSPGSAAFGPDWFYAENAGIGRAGAVIVVGLSTGMDLSTDLVTINDHHLCCYKRGTTLEPTCPIGVIIGANAVHSHWPFSDGNSYWDAGNQGTARVSAADAVRQGLYLGVRTSASNIVLYRGGAVLATTGAGSGGGLPTSSPFVLCTNLNGNSQEHLSNTIRLAGYSVGFGMNAVEQLDYYNAWQAFQTALGRQV